LRLFERGEVSTAGHWGEALDVVGTLGELARGPVDVGGEDRDRAGDAYRDPGRRLRVVARVPVGSQRGGDGVGRPVDREVGQQLVARERRLELAADLVAAALAATARGDWYRLKLCAADDCRWAFYDDSRNGLGRWCAMRVCGNRIKTKRYRAQRHGRTPTGPAR
jgi:CGNR zinc finger